jgi:hypothetical protein
MTNDSQSQTQAFHLARIDALERMVKSLEMQVDDLQFELDADNRMTFYNNQKVTPAPLEAEASQKQALTIINNYIQND